MAIVTVTSDLGNGSIQLAALKGAILKYPDSIDHIVDISNEIEPYNIIEGAYVFKNSYKHFPEKTIHLININPFFSKNFNIILLKKNGHYFIAPNNGFLSLVFENEPSEEYYQLNNFSDSTSKNELIGATIEKIHNVVPIEEIGEHTDQISTRLSLQPVLSNNTIRGTIIFIDRFGNLISNIKLKQFEKLRAGKRFAIYFRHKDPITTIKSHYHEVQIGEELCLFNASGYLVIAINLGNAHSILGLALNDIIQIDFFD
jgi:S-adenosylmethionine hydrolase